MPPKTAPPRRGPVRSRKRPRDLVSDDDSDHHLPDIEPAAGPDAPAEPSSRPAAAPWPPFCWWPFAPWTRSAGAAARPPAKRRRSGRRALVVDRIAQLRQSLLDLSLHSGFLSAAFDADGGGDRGVRVPSLQPAEVYRQLVQEGQGLRFISAKVTSATGVPSPLPPSALSSDSTPEELNRRLTLLHSKARTLQQQWGFNVLYFALGVLQWVDRQSPMQLRFAPLLLLPAELSKAQKGQYELRLRDSSEPCDNLSLLCKLRADYQVDLPQFEGSPEYRADPHRYFAAAAHAVGDQPGWRVKSAGLLGLFSFGKASMYRDLDPDIWPAAAAIEEHPIVSALLDPTRQQPMPSHSWLVDATLPARPLFPLPADATQADVVRQALQGSRGLLIDGPPGTGKSQTICNIIANAVATDRTVLFLSSKQAALDVVRRQLTQLGLGPACLDLHSRDATFKTVLRDVRESLELQPPQSPRSRDPPGGAEAELAGLRQQLLAHSALLHTPIGSTGLTPYDALQRLSALREENATSAPLGAGKAVDVLGADVARWGPEEVERREALMGELGRRVAPGPAVSRHPWRGVHALPGAGQEDAIVQRLTLVDKKLSQWDTWLASRVNAAAWDTDDALLVRGVLHLHRSGWAGWLATSLSGSFGDAMDRFRRLLTVPVPPDPEDQLRLLDSIVVARRQAGALDGELADLLLLLRAQPSDVFPVPAGHCSLPEYLYRLPLTHVVQQVQQWLAHKHLLAQWLGLWPLIRECSQQGLGPLVRDVLDRRVDASAAVAAFQRAFLEALLRGFLMGQPATATHCHTEMMERVRRGVARQRSEDVAAVQARYFQHRQRRLRLAPAAAKVLLGEVHRAKGHRYLRLLLQRTSAGPAVQALKPVFMMTPMSVATLLEPGSVSFDVLIIDEASQMQPVEALGAVARASQVIIVGDELQLPPTRFFDRLTDGGEDDAGEEEGDVAASVGDMRSVLSLAAARGFPRCALRWHYRSRHESLIALSNRELYDGQLRVVPSVQGAGPDVGLFFEHVPEGRFDRGQRRHNVVEARRVAEAVRRHARQCPGLTLGVCTFSDPQRKAVADALEDLRKGDTVLDEFLARGEGDFFVKNLENVQGDEQDVIFVSIGYGLSTADNSLPRNFGPLAMAGGECRLNVLITRAKYRMVVFSSVRASELDLPANPGRGLTMLRKFIAFAESRDAQLPAVPGCPMGTALRRQLTACGLALDGPLGSRDCRVDLAVRHPSSPNCYALGIVLEKDSPGPDDRLAVLRDCGWPLEAVCAWDWYRDPQAVVQRVLDAVHRCGGAAARPISPVSNSVPAGGQKGVSVPRGASPRPASHRPPRPAQAGRDSPDGHSADAVDVDTD